MQKRKTSVVICGAGPAGLTLAHLLGAENIDVILLEKLEDTVQEPRAIAIDGESLRTLQRVNLLEGFKDEILMGIRADYVNGEGKLLFEAGDPDARPYGFPMVNSFDQPSLDRYLARTLESLDCVSLCFNHTLERFEQNASGVQVYCTDSNDQPVSIQADYLVGCDGGRSTIRSQLGIAMHGESNPLPWLVIDTIDPFLDDKLPCRFFCDPRRPGMTIRKKHRQRRWEWMLMPGEDREKLLEDDIIGEIIAPFTDVEQVTVYRKRVYDFHAIVAERWREGRVFLAGDAAHMTPPFAGQGLNSGFRDVSNLSWKLAAVIKRQADAAILDSYEAERIGHAKELIETAVNLGRQIQPIDPIQAAERDAFFAELHKDPSAMQALSDEMFKSIVARSINEGLVLDPGNDSLAGKMLNQPALINQENDSLLMDESLGRGFAIVGYNCDPRKILDPDTLLYWNQLDTRFVSIESKATSGNSQRLVDSTGQLCDWMGGRNKRLILVRPDRICMVSGTPETASQALKEAQKLMDRA